jgi:CysZ protein
MFASAGRALRLVFDPAFARILVRSVLLTLLLFAALILVSEYFLSFLPVLGSPLVNHALQLLAPILLLLSGVVLGPPVAALFASLFLDRLARHIEARDYPEQIAKPASFAQTMRAGLRFAGLVLGANLVMVPLEIGLPGAGEMISLLVNGWLLGREYFELAAMRHQNLTETDRMRTRNKGAIWAAGTLIALASMIPVADLIAPLFGTALMVHLFHRVAGPKTPI